MCVHVHARTRVCFVSLIFLWPEKHLLIFQPGEYSSAVLRSEAVWNTVWCNNFYFVSFGRPWQLVIIIRLSGITL